MQRRGWVWGLLALMFCAGAAPDGREFPTSSAVLRRPNVVVILADDLGYGDLGCYGQAKIQTPHLDRLAQSGVRFTNFYAGSTVCAPSRCSLLTGRHTAHSSIRGNKGGALRPDEQTVANLLRNAGYATAAIGKWGVGESPQPGDPDKYGFASFFGYLDMWHAHNYYPDYLWQDSARVVLKGNIVKTVGQGGVALKRSQYSHDLFTAKALSYIEEHQHDPFFLYLAPTIPHANNEAGNEGMEVPDDAPYSERDWPQVQKNRAAMITRLDQMVGHVVEKLTQLELSSNTLVLFTSDNGPHAEGGADASFFESSGRLRGRKRDLYEGGIRVPLIASWPGKIPAGRVSHHLSAGWDVLPTLADVACIDTPAAVDGVSFLPTLLGRNESQQQHLFLYWEFSEKRPMQAVRLGKWKYVRETGGRAELYNLEVDPGETRDVAAQNVPVMKSIDFILQTIHDQPTRAASPPRFYNQRQKVKVRQLHRPRDDDDDDDD